MFLAPRPRQRTLNTTSTLTGPSSAHLKVTTILNLMFTIILVCLTVYPMFVSFNLPVFELCSVLFLRCIYADILYFHFCIARVYTICFITSTGGGCLGCFQFGLLWTFLCLSPDAPAKSGMAGSWAVCMPQLTRQCLAWECLWILILAHSWCHSIKKLLPAYRVWNGVSLGFKSFKSFSWLLMRLNIFSCLWAICAFSF